MCETLSLQRNTVGGVAFLLVDDFGVDLGRVEFLVSEQFLHRVDVCSEVKHYYGECVASAVERDVFRDSCPDSPSFQLHEVIGRVREVREDVVFLSASFPHIGDRLGIDVDVFLSACLLLPKDDSCEFALLSDLFPFHLLDVALAESCQAGKHEGSFEDWVFALCRRHSLDLVEREVHSLSFLQLEALDASQWVVWDYTVFKGLVYASPELVEIGDFACVG